MAVIGLNPSTATETQDDPTVNRCWKLAKREGYDAFCMLNLFALRSTNPKQLYLSDDPVGIENDYWIHKIASDASVVVAAWGVHGALNSRGCQVAATMRDIKCLGTTKFGHPKHPLYLKKDTLLVPFGGIDGYIGNKK